MLKIDLEPIEAHIVQNAEFKAKRHPVRRSRWKEGDDEMPFDIGR